MLGGLHPKLFKKLSLLQTLCQQESVIRQWVIEAKSQHDKVVSYRDRSTSVPSVYSSVVYLHRYPAIHCLHREHRGHRRHIDVDETG